MNRRLQSIPDVFAPSDPLGEALQVLRMSAAFYVDSEFTSPWGLDIPPMADCVMFHVVVEGSCSLIAGDEQRTLRAGDCALIPHGDGHVLQHGVSARSEKLFDLPHDHVAPHFAHLRFGGGGALTRMICGVVRSDVPGTRRLLDLLPVVVHVPNESGVDHRWIETILPLIASEARDMLPGGESLLSRLADVVVIAAIRSWLSSEPHLRAGLYAGLSDPQIGSALAAFHRNPERSWTLGTLANAATMSRSAFAARFTERVGESAMQYVTRWRMCAAFAALRRTDASLAEVAGRAGYRSEAAFSRAFKRVIGSPPGVARQHPHLDDRA